jgi:serine/threonine protein kinase
MNDISANIEIILAEAVEIPIATERDAFLDKACGGDGRLRARVERLVKCHLLAGNFLEQPAIVVEPDSLAPEHTPVEGPGTQIGPYKIIEQIGEGGMGLVYMAEQQQPLRRMVALKIIKPGMATRHVVARFEAERQALAMMDHPNIARIYDAGTTHDSTGAAAGSGRPYFVMELVRGIPITTFCDQKQLNFRERLQLFQQVCQAVQHAHQKGIIHRDLKPTNVLVTMHDVVAIPKVIDFGVAKALAGGLTEHTLHTGFMQLIGTPLYMSPEQAELNELGVDTRSDIYSLGVLLYELVTGTTPFDKDTLREAGFDEMRRMIREDDPPRPSQRLSTLNGKAALTQSDGRSRDDRRFHQRLRGELDWVVMKSLEKDRNRRYESVSALAEDIQRFLADEPIIARPKSAWYLGRKFIHRHRALVVIVITLLMTVILLGGLVSNWRRSLKYGAAVEALTHQAQMEDERERLVRDSKPTLSRRSSY